MYNLTKATFHLDSIFRGPTHQTAIKKGHPTCIG